MSRSLGSLTFGTSQVRTDEYVMLLKVAVANGASLEQAALDIEAIDEMLQLQKIESLINSKRFTATGRIRKNSSFLDTLDKRIDQLTEESRNLITK